MILLALYHLNFKNFVLHFLQTYLLMKFETRKPLTVVPPGIFIGGGAKKLGSGAEPRKFFFHHTLYFAYKRDQRPLHRLRSRIINGLFLSFYNRKWWNVDCRALNSNPVLKRPYRKVLSH